MMGSNDKPQDELFYAFNLDEIVPQDHLLRDIDRVLDLSDLLEHLAPYYSHTGRPSVDPELMIRMLLIGYCGGSRAINEYLDALQDDGSSIAPAKKVSQTDPMARWTAVLGGPAYYAYSTNYLVDTEAGIIVDVEATPALRTPEVWSTKTMIERVKDRFGIEVKRLIGDTAYGTAEFLGWMVNEAEIEPHVPVWDRGEGKDGRFGRSDFIYDRETDSYICPNGKELERFRRNFKKPRTGITKSNEIKYRASKLDCTACPMKAQCCPNTEIRKVTRSVHELARDVARAVGQTPAYRRTRRQRKQVEMLFAHMKRILKMDRLRLRGISGARDEFLLTATAQNLRRMAKLLGTGPPGIRQMAVT